MSNKKEDDTRFDDDFVTAMAWTFSAIFFFAFAAVAIYMWNFRQGPIATDPASWGQLGDYLGGVINPAVGLATVFLIVISITIQRRELRSSLKEMKNANEAAARMSFEQSLFTWLENYHSQIRDIEQGIYKGRKVLLHLHEQSLSPRLTAYPGASNPPPDNAAGNQVLIRLNVPGAKGLEQLAERQFRATITYQMLYQKHKSDFDAPFRTLYRLIRWIDNSPLTDREKWHYCTLVRSQLSWPELVFLYYNGLITEGEKLAVYANKYALFDNILASDELIRFATDELTRCRDDQRPRTRDSDKPWPYLRSAFDSREAKKALGISIEA